MLASSVDPCSGNQKTSLEGRLVFGREVDNLVDYFLGNFSWVGLCHARYRQSWAVKQKGEWYRDGEEQSWAAGALRALELLACDH